MIRHCGTCSTWERLSRTLSRLGSCEVEAARLTRGIFTCKLALTPWSAVCGEWKAKDKEEKDG